MWEQVILSPTFHSATCCCSGLMVQVHACCVNGSALYTMVNQPVSPSNNLLCAFVFVWLFELFGLCIWQSQLVTYEINIPTFWDLYFYYVTCCCMCVYVDWVHVGSLLSLGDWMAVFFVFIYYIPLSNVARCCCLHFKLKLMALYLQLNVLRKYLCLANLHLDFWEDRTFNNYLTFFVTLNVYHSICSSCKCSNFHFV